jgi:hypothetical protein
METNTQGNACVDCNVEFEDEDSLKRIVHEQERTIKVMITQLPKMFEAEVMEMILNKFKENLTGQN